MATSAQLIAARFWRPTALIAVLLLTAACGSSNLSQSSKGMPSGERAYFIDPTRKAEAIKEAKVKRSKGERVWCVPFARTLSGVELRGNAGTWWKAAAGTYDRGSDPAVGSVMAFSSTKKMPMGHVAVVSEVVSSREVLIDHANWSRNQVSLKMPVVDVSPNNDWSKVRVAYNDEGDLGGEYPLNGFIYPEAKPLSLPTAAEMPVALSEDDAIAAAIAAAQEEPLAAPIETADAG